MLYFKIKYILGEPVISLDGLDILKFIVFNHIQQNINRHNLCYKLLVKGKIYNLLY
jgi:hypothetical protein